MEDFEKTYYKIKDVAEIIGVPQSTIRYWEKNFDILTPARSTSGARLYTPADIENLRIIYYLLKQQGLKIDAAKAQMSTNRKNLSRKMEIIGRLESVKGSLQELMKALNYRQ